MVEEDKRPDPDELLSIINAQESDTKKGRLKVFFGGCAGVGKTYAMLSSAQERFREGLDVVVGIVETHGRGDTEKMLEGLPKIPLKEIQHKGITIKEFDLDAAIARKPAIILIDEFAHTNAPGSRHPKRWQDVEELLDEGIDVYTTLNVQHLESLNDVVAKIANVWVKETVPDTIFDRADDISLVDIPTDELLKRLKEGKVYIAPQAKNRAAQNFFRKSNLIALRELALRRTAERVDAQMNMYNVEQGRDIASGASDRVMVCIGPDTLSGKLVRSAKRMASSLNVPWVAVYVENHRHYGMNKKGHESVERTMRLAERMGAKVEILQGNNAAEELLAYARKNGITRIIAGKPTKSRWKDVLYGSLVDRLINGSGDIDIYVISGKPDEKKFFSGMWNFPRQIGYYTVSIMAIAACSGLVMLLRERLADANLLTIYLVGVVGIALNFGIGPSVLAAVLAVLSFNLIVDMPYYTIDLDDGEYTVAMVVMALTAYFVSSQSRKLRLQAVYSRKREKDTGALYAMTRELASTRGHQNIAKVAARHIGEVFDGRVSIWSGNDQDFRLLYGDSETSDPKEEVIARWAYDHVQNAGAGTDTMTSASGIYVPLDSASGVLGAMGVVPNKEGQEFSSEQENRLETFASLLASSLERANIADLAERTKIDAESEKIRSLLLSTVSHELRIPLASISVAANGLLEGSERLAARKRSMIGTIRKQVAKLARIVTNLVDVASLESGAAKLNRNLYVIEEIISCALLRVEETMSGRKIKNAIQEGLPMVSVDGILIEQAMVNLIENAIRYTSPEGEIEISAYRHDNELIVSVIDDGPRIIAGEETHIFSKSYTNEKRGNYREQKPFTESEGTELAVCRGIVSAHGGRIWAENIDRGGVSVTFTIPFDGDANHKEGGKRDDKPDSQ